MFLRRVAVSEGYAAKDWYEYFVEREFQAIQDNDFIIEDLDAERMKELYGHKQT